MLLEIKAIDLRSDAILQCRTSADGGIHVGGAYSAIPALTALYYGGIFRFDVEHPTSLDQDVFLLSKGHAVAAQAAVMADVGYFAREHLTNSRGYGALVKGHPGPAIPGVPVATGPLGHGISVACGYALVGRQEKMFDAYCMMGDGELQEGSCWEAFQFASANALTNLCVLIDCNNGQSDDAQKLILSGANLGERMAAFGFTVLEARSDDIGSILRAMERFKFERGPRPCAILCHGIKGGGGYAAVMGKHKANLSDDVMAQEDAFLARKREGLVARLNRLDTERAASIASGMGYDVALGADGTIAQLNRRERAPLTKRAETRDKALRYDAGKLPEVTAAGKYGAWDILSACSAAFASDWRYFTVDADLSNASGLFPGTESTNREHAVNAGIAECNMMNMAEAFAAIGGNVWVSTFGPFFNWQALRRIAVSYQERENDILFPNGWLSAGHNLDITFVCTAANLDSAVNGATHMSNDDICLFDQVAHLRIIDICCPRQLREVARWISEGNRGLIYLRVMRNPSEVIYPEPFTFEYGRATELRTGADVAILTSGHGVLEALAAEELLRAEGIAASVYDVHSTDEDLFRKIALSERPVLFAEQNNGILFDRYARFLLAEGLCARSTAHAVNTRNAAGHKQYIQSGTYGQLTSALHLDAAAIARRAHVIVEGGNEP